YGAAAGGGAEPEAKARFDSQLAAIAAQLDQLTADSGRETPAQRRFRETFATVAQSWSKAYGDLSSDLPAAITELSVRADPLAEKLLRELLPKWEEEVKREVAEASAKLRRTS